MTVRRPRRTDLPPPAFWPLQQTVVRQNAAFLDAGGLAQWDEALLRFCTATWILLHDLRRAFGTDAAFRLQLFNEFFM